MNPNSIPMVQQPFDSAGVQAKQVELYALSNNALLTEANAVRSNFAAWMNTNFILSAAQQSYITSMDTTFVNFLANNVGLAIEYRLSITLTAPFPLPAPSISKMIELEPQLIPVFNQSSGVAVTGSIVIRLTY